MAGVLRFCQPRINALFFRSRALREKMAKADGQAMLMCAQMVFYMFSFFCVAAFLFLRVKAAAAAAAGNVAPRSR